MLDHEAAPGPSPLGVAMIGYAFMGKAHSNAWRNVASYFDVPAFERRVLVGRDPAGAAAAAAQYGWAESATDWRQVIARDDIDIVDICAPGWSARRDRHRRPGRGQARPRRKAAGQLPWPRPKPWSRPHGRRSSAACSPWWGSTTGGFLRWRWPGN